MIKLTLDTNCIINLLDYKSESATSVDELSEIINYALEGNVNVAITTRVEKDFEKDKDTDRKKKLLKRLSMFTTIGSVARFGSTKLDNGDVWGDSEHKELEDELTKIIFPGLSTEEIDNKINDVDHLIGHKINERDIFVTDDKPILKKSEQLKNTLDISVMNPEQVLEYLDLQANKIVLVQDFFDRFIEFKDEE